MDNLANACAAQDPLESHAPYTILEGVVWSLFNPL